MTPLEFLNNHKRLNNNNNNNSNSPKKTLYYLQLHNLYLKEGKQGLLQIPFLRRKCPLWMMMKMKLIIKIIKSVCLQKKILCYLSPLSNLLVVIIIKPKKIYFQTLMKIPSKNLKFNNNNNNNKCHHHLHNSNKLNNNLTLYKNL